MYDLNDTIVAVSSPTSDKRAIIRMSGPATIETCRQLFTPPITAEKSSLVSGTVTIEDDLKIDAQLYLFPAPHSYTGDEVAEIHMYTNSSVTEALMGSLLSKGLRMAGPGEFTARAYLNGKIDLTQAEAVGEIVASSNRLQLEAAEKLLAGRLAESTAKICSAITDCLSLIEAGLDFSGEDIEFISCDEAVARLAEIKGELEQLLAGSISYESVIDLPAVGITGAPNAGKSSLLNRLLGRERSIVSRQRKTTRDVLTGLLTLSHCECILFDCAGLTLGPNNIIDELAQHAAIEALRNSSVVVFCVDISKGTPFCNKAQNGNPTDWSEDLSIRRLMEPKTLLLVATKCDLVPEQVLAERVAALNERFAADFLPISVMTNAGVEQLQDTIDSKIIEMSLGTHPEAPALAAERPSSVALTARHRQAVTDAIENVTEAIEEVKTGNDEAAAMLLRGAYQSVSNIEQHVDEKILERIFSHFCIGK